MTKVEFSRSASAPDSGAGRGNGCCPWPGSTPGLWPARCRTGGRTPSFDALLLPEGGVRLKQIAHQLWAAGSGSIPHKVRLLGSGLWDDPAIVSEPALYGGWFAASPPEAAPRIRNPVPGDVWARTASARLACFRRGRARRGFGPERRDREPFAHEAILNPNGFTGVDGLFRFTQEGLVQRGLAVMEVQQQGTVVVSPAPASFRDLAF